MTIGLLKDNRRKSRFKSLGERSNGFVATYSPMSRKKFVIGRLSRSLLCNDGPKSLAGGGHFGPMGPRSDVSWVMTAVGWVDESMSESIWVVGTWKGFGEFSALR